MPLDEAGRPEAEDLWCFDRYDPKKTKPLDDDVFEIGLVLAGAVSAGAYTAGVLDFLYEALDAWYDAKRRQPETVPGHKVRVRAITGASAGGMNGAISAVALDKVFPPARPDADAEDRRKNPFYRAWVEDIDIKKLLGTDDLEEGIFSALDCTELENIRDRLIRFEGRTDDSGRPIVPTTRDWIPPGWPLLLTVSNLRGVPYTIRFEGSDGGYPMSLHRDFMGFTAPIGRIDPNRSAPVQAYKAPPEFKPGDTSLEDLGNAALATGAFPFGLRARLLSRPRTDYDDRTRIPDPLTGEFKNLRPNWPAGVPDGSWRFLCVDGGVMNNEPFELARKILAGVKGENPPGASEARRAVLMIDPFVEPGPSGPCGDLEIHDLALPIFNALKSQTRFTEVDIDLIANEQVFNRFLIAPSRSQTAPAEDLKGKGALVSSELGAFAGFLHKTYREHDFMLGRRNCQWFLKHWFVLKADNPLFKGQSPNVLQRYESAQFPGFFQIIPVVPAVDKEEPLPPWPRNQVDYRRDLKERVDARVDAIFDQVFARISGEANRHNGLLASIRAWARGRYLWFIKRDRRKWLSRKIEASVAGAIEAIDRRFAD